MHLSVLSREGNGTPLQYSCLVNPMGRGAWWAAVNGVAKSRTRLSSFTFTFHFHALEKEMAAHSSVLAWRIPGTVEPGGLPSNGLHRVRQDWSDLAEAEAAASILRCKNVGSYKFNNRMRIPYFFCQCWWFSSLGLLSIFINLYYGISLL